MPRIYLWLPALFTACCILAVTSALAAEDPERGKVVFEQCAACHSLEAGKTEVGPSLHGLFGRRSGSEDFTYSPALRRAKVTWTPELLDDYLTDPQAGVFRGNRMPFSGIADSQVRTDLISYLKRATR
jgi:cytochrome c2